MSLIDAIRANSPRNVGDNPSPTRATEVTTVITPAIVIFAHGPNHEETSSAGWAAILPNNKGDIFYEGNRLTAGTVYLHRDGHTIKNPRRLYKVPYQTDRSRMRLYDVFDPREKDDHRPLFLRRLAKVMLGEALPTGMSIRELMALPETAPENLKQAKATFLQRIKDQARNAAQSFAGVMNALAGSVNKKQGKDSSQPTELATDKRLIMFRRALNEEGAILETPEEAVVPKTRSRKRFLSRSERHRVVPKRSRSRVADKYDNADRIGELTIPSGERNPFDMPTGRRERVLDRDQRTTRFNRSGYKQELKAHASVKRRREDIRECQQGLDDYFNHPEQLDEIDLEKSGHGPTKERRTKLGKRAERHRYDMAYHRVSSKLDSKKQKMAVALVGAEVRQILSRMRRGRKRRS